MGNVLKVTYASSITDLCEINSSFDTGVLRICYTGQNRNGSAIDRKTLEKCIPTLYNCPVVCHYDRDSDELGGHDVELTRSSDGTMKIVNTTQPVGVIPESAKVWFDDFEEEDGTVHEYLYSEVLLWKRQEAYQKIKRDGITAHSMEINVKDGGRVDGVFNILDFEFTAFCLIGVEPCYESSTLEVFEQDRFKQQMFEMMQDLKETFVIVDTSTKFNDIHLQNSMEGGERALDKKMELAFKYNVDINSLDFSLDDFTVEELEEKFSAMQNVDNPDIHITTSGSKSDNGQFALTEPILEEMRGALHQEMVHSEWGEYPRYCYADSDFELSEVYAWDCEDWNLYGFKYEKDGDLIKIDFDSKTRKKFVIADFDGGEQDSPFEPVFTMMARKIQDNADLEEKYQAISERAVSMEAELRDLRKFKADSDASIAKAQRDELFSRFSDLEGNEAFEAIRENSAELNIETLEEKCFAIRGRVGTVQKFSLEDSAPKMVIDRTKDEKEPYGGVFKEYAIGD